MKQSTNCKQCGTCCCNIPIYEHEATKIGNGWNDERDNGSFH